MADQGNSLIFLLHIPLSAPLPLSVPLVQMADGIKLIGT